MFYIPMAFLNYGSSVYFLINNEYYFSSFFFLYDWKLLANTYGRISYSVCEDLVPHHLFLKCDTKNAFALPTK